MAIRTRHAPGVLVEDLDQDVCLYRADIDEVLVLNATAGDVWRLADGEYELDQVIQRLAAAYQLAANEIRDQVRAVVADLLDRGYLVRVAEEPAEPADRAG